MKELNLMQDNDTHSNSTYDMLDHLLGQTALIHATFTDNNIKKDRSALFTSDEQANAEELLVVLKELKTATTIVCDQKTPSVSMIMPVLLKLKKSLSVSESDSTLVKAVKTSSFRKPRYTLSWWQFESASVCMYFAWSQIQRHDYRWKHKNCCNQLINWVCNRHTNAIDVQSVPVKSEPATAPEMLLKLPTLPPALMELAVSPKKENEIEIPSKKLKTEPVPEDSFLDDWFQT